MTSCMDGHLFCLDCAKANAETTVGSGKLYTVFIANEVYD
jgi:hypothetical protein